MSQSELLKIVSSFVFIGYAGFYFWTKRKDEGNRHLGISIVLLSIGLTQTWSLLKDLEIVVNKNVYDFIGFLIPISALAVCAALVTSIRRYLFGWLCFTILILFLGYLYV